MFEALGLIFGGRGFTVLRTDGGDGVLLHVFGVVGLAVNIGFNIARRRSSSSAARGASGVGCRIEGVIAPSPYMAVGFRVEGLRMSDFGELRRSFEQWLQVQAALAFGSSFAAIRRPDNVAEVTNSELFIY